MAAAPWHAVRGDATCEFPMRQVACKEIMRFPLLLACFWALVHARPATPSTHTLHQKRDSTASRWTRRDRIEPSAMLPIRIALTQSDLHKGHDWLMDV